jgi:hypothetical protein
MTAMTFDEMLDTWRAQDKTPLYGVNRDLLQLVLRHEQHPLRRSFRLEAGILYACYSGAAVGLSIFFLMIYMERHYGDEPRQFWGYIVAAAGVALSLVCGVGLWISRQRQAQRERSFGNTLRDEIQRHLTLLDYALSRKGQARRSFLTIAPIAVLTVIFSLLASVVNGLPIDSTRILRKAIVIPVFFLLVATWESRKVREHLLPRQQRLRDLLAQLDARDLEV